MKNVLPRSAKLVIALAFAISLSVLGISAFADDDDCRDPVAKWQPREVLKKHLEAQGWVVHRIRIDDRCYEVRAIDDQGRRVEASYAPATLKLLEFEVEDEEHERREHHQSESHSR
ncbi:PepSY domain-containing protein [Zhongshania sp.]|uniref:PepSY domain-containing protein n=1 Tax=Zhongshania sp. TaxID=1971902 RepID=UPI001B730B80|nr:PepSY domain-containing protein [Zhongshania sp.]MBQ0797086.1 PepSY domain-containing protein [Zhongshania sp.]|tara:strand:+ start:725 stop:1072 length:348 start_codon:yes stop_codon:yes gene_type:complete